MACTIYLTQPSADKRRPGVSYERPRREGNLPLAHLSLLAHTPERLLALRLAMSQAIGPASAVLDAGCGALGVLPIMAPSLVRSRSSASTSANCRWPGN